MNVALVHEQLTRKDIYISIGDDAQLETDDYIIYQDVSAREKIGQVKFSIKDSKLPSDQLNTNVSLLRKATAHDLQKMETLKKRSEKAKEVCQDLIEKHKLDMKLAFAEYSLDGNQINFIYTAEDRVDFRELVKDLAKSLKRQIHLQQIGPRDLSKILGGMGKCGRIKCCTWLPRLESITMDMVRVQGLENRGISKLTGVCGKLRCCIKYEVDIYKQKRKNLPSIGNIIKVKKREARVIALDVLNGKVKVSYPDRSFAIIDEKDVEKIVSHEEVKDTSDPILN